MTRVRGRPGVCIHAHTHKHMHTHTRSSVRIDVARPTLVLRYLPKAVGRDVSSFPVSGSTIGSDGSW
jgi:hypothetical protein